jgi:RNA polymerase sigma-70 factor, ECF subfamily
MHFPPAFDSSQFTSLLAAARSGDDRALGEFLKAYRGFLLAIAKRNISGPVRAKLDESDIVQQTLSEAAEHFEQFAGMVPQELASWLRAGLLNNVRDCHRRFGAERRSVGREVSLDADSALHRKLTSDLPSPSTRILKEDRRRLVDAAIGSGRKSPPAGRTAATLVIRCDLFRTDDYPAPCWAANQPRSH